MKTFSLYPQTLYAHIHSSYRKYHPLPYMVWTHVYAELSDCLHIYEAICFLEATRRPRYTPLLEFSWSRDRWEDGICMFLQSTIFLLTPP